MMNFDKNPPATIPEAIAALEAGLHEKDKAHLVAYGVSGAHHSLGRNIRNGWDLWMPAADIVRWSKATYGVDHADDISSLILGGLVERLGGSAFDIEAEAEVCRRHWRDMAAMGDGQVVSLAGPFAASDAVPPPPSLRFGADRPNIPSLPRHERKPGLIQRIFGARP